MKNDNNIINEARTRWASLVLETQICEVRDEWQRMHEDCPQDVTVGTILEIIDDRPGRFIYEQQTVGDVLDSFDTKSDAIEGDLEKNIGKVVDELMKYAEDLEGLPYGDLKANIESAGGDAPDNAKKMGTKTEFDEEEAKELHDQAKEALKQKIIDIANDLKAIVNEFNSNKDAEGPKKAAAMAFKKSGQPAFEKINALRKDPVAQAAASGYLGTKGKDKLKKVMTDLVKEFVPFGKQMMNAWKMMKGAMKAGGKIKGLFAKFKKSNAEPEDKFADMAAKIARGKDKQMGEFAKVLQLDDNIEAVIDDRLEIKYIEDYVAKLRDIPPETPLADIDINDMITNWVKQQGHENVDLSVDAA